MRRFAFPALVSLTALGLACSDAGQDLPWKAPPELGEIGSAIINGSPDNDHPAVMAVLSNYGACSGTMVDVSGNAGYVLTAAHCVDDPPQYVVQHKNYACIQSWNCDGIYPVTDYEAHSYYNGSVYDFAMLTVSGAGSAPTIPAAATDSLNSSTPIKHVGYGQTEDGDNSTRHYYNGVISILEDLLLYYGNYPNGPYPGGPCFGDSGGPQLTMTNEKVVGVSSFVGDNNCSTFGASGRVSRVSGWIESYISGGGGGAPMDCDQCFTWSTSGSGPCADEVQDCFNHPDCSDLVDCLNGCSTQTCANQCAADHPSGTDVYLLIYDCVCDVGCVTECESDAICQGSGGSGGSGGSAGSGGSGGDGATGGSGGSGASGAEGGTGTGEPSGNGWVAGGRDDEKYKGEILSSCSLSDGRGGAGGPWAVLLGLVLASGAWARRRR